MPSRDHMLGFPGVVDWIPEPKPAPRATRTPDRRAPTTAMRVVPGPMRTSDVARFHAPLPPQTNYPFLITHIDRLGYRGWIGCEWRNDTPPTEPGFYILRNNRREADLRINEDGSWTLSCLRPRGELRGEEKPNHMAPLKRLAPGVEWSRVGDLPCIGDRG